MQKMNFFAKRFIYFFAVFILFLPLAFFGKEDANAKTEDYARGRIIVKLKRNISLRNKSFVLSQQRLFPRTKRGLLRDEDKYFILYVSPGKEKQALNLLRKNPLVESADLDYVFKPAGFPNDPYFPKQWQYKEGYMPMTEVWHSPSPSNIPVIAIIDTGVNINHPDIKNRIWVNPREIPNNSVDDDGNGYIDDVHGANVHEGSNNILDDNGHGTAVAGVAAASSNNGIGVTGMDWKSKVLVVKANISGSSLFNASDLTRALHYVGGISTVKVINLSISGYSYIQTMDSLLKDLTDKGVTIVAGAGNDSSSVGYPASSPFVIAVSSYGPEGFSPFSNYGYAIDVAAPGEFMYSLTTTGGYAQFDGTSFSSPTVAGFVATLSAYYPDLTPREKTQIIKNWAACPLEDSNCPKNFWSKKYGFGRLNGKDSFFNRCSLDSPFLRSETEITYPDPLTLLTSNQKLEVRGFSKSNVFKEFKLYFSKEDNIDWQPVSSLNNPLQQKTNEVLGWIDLSGLLYSGNYLVKLETIGNASCLNNIVGRDVARVTVKRVFKVSGWVKDINNKPVSDVVIQYYDSSGNGVGWVRTNDSGYFEKNDLLEGDYKVKAISNKPNVFFEPEFHLVSLREGKSNVTDLVFRMYTASVMTPTPTPTPGVDIIWPNGGQTLYVDRTYKLRWKQYGISSVSLYLSSCKNCGPSVYIGYVPYSNLSEGQFTWKVPYYLAGKSFYFMVIGYSNNSYYRDYSDRPIRFDYFNNKPIIKTNSLPKAYYHKVYKAVVEIYDEEGNYVTLSVKNLPNELTLSRCFRNYKTTRCLITGVPRTKGRFYPEFIARDSRGGVTRKKILLDISMTFPVPKLPIIW